MTIDDGDRPRQTVGVNTGGCPGDVAGMTSAMDAGDGRHDGGRHCDDAGERAPVATVADLERLAGETAPPHRERLPPPAEERSARAKAEQERDALRQELDVIEASLAAGSSDATPDTAPDRRLDGVVLLYVGGRAQSGRPSARGGRAVRRNLPAP